jgi:hypothetical protein
VSFNLEGLVIAVFFLLPGFIATSIYRSRHPIRRIFQKKSALYEALESLMVAIGIVLVQIVMLVLASLVWDNVLRDISSIAQNGFLAYIANHPLRSQFVILFWIISACIIAILAGFVGYFKLFSNVQWLPDNLKDIPPNSHVAVWWDALMDAPLRNEKQQSLVRVWLKSGVCYEGWMENFELPNNTYEDHSFWLIDVLRYKTREEAESGSTNDHMAAVLLNTREVESIDIWWGDGPEKPEGDS